MSALFWFLLMIAPVVAIGYVLWAHRQKSAGREAASQERYAMLVGAARSPGTPASEARSDQPGPAPVAVAPAPTAAPAAPAAAPPVDRDRFLSQPATLLYYVLKAGLPEHVVFARVGMASVIDASAVRAPALLRQDLDFLICDKNMRTVAAVLLEGRVAGPMADAVSQALGAAGIRVVKVNPAAPPKREAVKALILGAN